MDFHYTVFQVKNGIEYHSRRFMNYDWIVRHHVHVDLNDYQKVYTSQMANEVNNPDEVLEKIFMLLNTRRPSEYKGRSLSVSDIVALTVDSVTTYYYCDSFGWEKLEGFTFVD